MAEIIKKEIIKIKNGDLKKMCKEHKTSIDKLQKALGLNSDLLYKFDRGERTITLDLWEKATEILAKSNIK